MRSPREHAEESERHPQLPPGSEERVAGYGVMGQTFESGHVLEQILGREIDLVDYGGLKPRLDDDIRRDAVLL
ncbi:hypothetical protein [Nocardioides sp. NPDC006273]|uniref:hypothetical protein n=1 Tax=Nocardioides sp. NPDC006273 TaxID=3155598 RepID=UPI0033A95D8A